MAFRIAVFFALLKDEIPNKKVSENLESLPLKFSSMLRMLLRKIDLSSEKNWTMKKVTDYCFQCFCHSNKLDLSNLENYV